jgi:putative flippase GtrA
MRKYSILSLLSALLVIGATFVLHQLVGFREDYAYLGGIVAAWFLNFAGMRYFIFPGSEKKFLVQAGHFFLSSIGFRLLEYAAFFMLANIFGIYYLLVTIAILGVSFIAKYLFYQERVFR